MPKQSGLQRSRKKFNDLHLQNKRQKQRNLEVHPSNIEIKEHRSFKKLSLPNDKTMFISFP